MCTQLSSEQACHLARHCVVCAGQPCVHIVKIVMAVQVAGRPKGLRSRGLGYRPACDHPLGYWVSTLLCITCRTKQDSHALPISLRPCFFLFCDVSCSRTSNIYVSVHSTHKAVICLSTSSFACYGPKPDSKQQVSRIQRHAIPHSTKPTTRKLLLVVSGLNSLYVSASGLRIALCSRPIISKSS